MKKHVPNAITLLNLLCGCAAVVSILDARFGAATWWLLGAGLADFADGLAARALGVSSAIGKELDSLADLVSFGLAPGALLYVMLALGPMPADWVAPGPGLVWAALPGFVLTLFSALRLARFNLDDRQTDHFLGLATPACTLLVLGWALLYEADTLGLRPWLGHPAAVYGLTATLSALLLAEIPMFSFKFSHLRWRGNAIRFIFAGVALASFAVWRQLALAPVMGIYLVVNLWLFLIQKRTSV